MELDFSPEQEELRSSVRAVLERAWPPSQVRAMVERGESPAALWKQQVALDWPALTVPEAHGGLGLGAVDLAVVVEELGRALAPGPLLPTVSQFVPAVLEVATPEQAGRFLRGVASGATTGTLALTDDGVGWDPGTVETTVSIGDGGAVVRGVKRAVVEAAAVDEIVVVARLAGSTGGGGVTAVVVPSASVEVRPLAVLDASRTLADVVLEGVEVDRDRVLGEPGQADAPLRRAVEQATVAMAVEMVGTCQAIFDTVLEYARVRHQFGVPIGSFQAVKHKLANLYVAIERARATAYFAAATIDEDDPRRTLAASMAKAAAGDCQRLVAQDGIQLLGGIGYTWEHDMHLYVKRAKAGDVLFGTAAAHRRRVAGMIGLANHDGT